MGRNGSGKSTLLNTLSGVRGRPGARRGGGPGPPERCARSGPVRHVGLVPQDPGLLLYGESVQAECAGRGQGVRHSRRGRLRARSSGYCPACPATAIRETSPRASAWPWPWPSWWLRPRPPPARRADQGAGLPEQGSPHRGSCASSPETATPSCWPPTTWSSPRAWRTGPWSWPTARSSPTARPARWSATRRSSPPRWPRCWPPRSG